MELLRRMFLSICFLFVCCPLFRFFIAYLYSLLCKTLLGYDLFLVLEIWCSHMGMMGVSGSAGGSNSVGEESNMWGSSRGSGKGIVVHSGTSSSSSWTEDSFEMRVLLEPFSEEGTSVNPTRVAADEAGPSHQRSFVPNASLESSLRNRIVRLENEESIFLLDKEKREYWNDIKTALDQAPSQREYNQLLEFENRDLQIRERKHSCYSLFQLVLSENPVLGENAPYNPREAFLDFFDEKRDELDAHPEWSTKERDTREIKFLTQVEQDLKKRGADSIYMKQILGFT